MELEKQRKGCQHQPQKPVTFLTVVACCALLLLKVTCPEQVTWRSCSCSFSCCFLASSRMWAVAGSGLSPRWWGGHAKRDAQQHGVESRPCWEAVREREGLLGFALLGSSEMQLRAGGCIHCILILQTKSTEWNLSFSGFLYLSCYVCADFLFSLFSLGKWVRSDT